MRKAPQENFGGIAFVCTMSDRGQGKLLLSLQVMIHAAPQLDPPAGLQ
jgi:hypothetical protein